MEINSKEYWNNRFASLDWEKCSGKEQTNYFGNVLLNSLPEKIFEDISSIIDWGCALGQLGFLWKSKNSSCEVFGYDLSEEAVQKAKKLYSDIIFSSEKPKRKFDAVVCSNVLEHLENWKETTEELKLIGSKYLIVLVPYNSGTGGEHVINFTEDMFSDEKIILKKTIDCYHPYYWPGSQILVVYKL